MLADSSSTSIHSRPCATSTARVRPPAAQSRTARSTTAGGRGGARHPRPCAGSAPSWGTPGPWRGIFMSECGDTARGSARKKRTTAVLAGAALLAPLGLLAVTGTASAADSGVWDRIAKCESGGDWHINTGNGYYGGLQFAAPTWRAYGGSAYAATADKASKAQQIAIATKVQRAQGWERGPPAPGAPERPAAHPRRPPPARPPPDRPGRPTPPGPGNPPRRPRRRRRRAPPPRGPQCLPR